MCQKKVAAETLTSNQSEPLTSCGTTEGIPRGVCYLHRLLDIINSILYLIKSLHYQLSVQCCTVCVIKFQTEKCSGFYPTILLFVY